jgi:TctA family transporter
VRWGLLVIWLITVFTFGAVTLEQTLGWTALVIGVLTLSQILMHAPDDGAPDHRPTETHNLPSQ